MPRRDDDRDDDRDDRLRKRTEKKKGTQWLWFVLGCGGVVLLGTILVAVAAIIIYFAWPNPGGVPGAVGPGAGGPPVEANPKIKQMPGLIAYWSFDEVKGAKITDHSGRGNHLTLVGGRIDQGVRGKGLWLDGPANQYCDIPPSADFNFAANAAFTFSGWVKTSLDSAAIVSLTSIKGPQQIDFIVRARKFIVVVGDDNDHNVQNAYVWSRQPNDGEWHNFVFLRRANKVQLWLDGVLQGEMAASQAGGAVTTDLRAIGSERLWIINNEQKYGNPSFQGGIDEVCVFNRAIEPAEIQVLLDIGR